MKDKYNKKQVNERFIDSNVVATSHRFADFLNKGW
jgi:hypothetical protein